MSRFNRKMGNHPTLPYECRQLRFGEVSKGIGIWPSYEKHLTVCRSYVVSIALLHWLIIFSGYFLFYFWVLSVVLRVLI